MPNDVYYICMYITIAFILLMEHQPEMGIWGLAGLWLDWPTPGGRKGKHYIIVCMWPWLCCFEPEIGK